MTENIPTEGQPAEAPPAGQEQEAIPSPEAQETSVNADNFLEKSGFKSYEEVAKSLKEGQQKITQQGQEMSELKQALQTESGQRAQLAQTLQQQVDKGTDFFDNPEMKSRQLARDEMGKMKRDDDIAELRAENPELWDMTAPYTQQVLRQNQYLNTGTKASLKKAFVMGQEQMKEAAKKQYNIMNTLIGDEMPAADGSKPPAQKTEEQIRKELLAEQQKNKDAYIPNTGSAVPMADDKQKKYDKAMADGDIDALLELKLNP